MSTALKILHVAPYSPDAWAYGGIPRVVAGLTQGLATRGHQVTLCATDAVDASRRLGPTSWRRRRVPLPPRVVHGVEWRIFRNVSNRAAYRWQAFAPFGLREYMNANAASFDIAHLHGCHHLPGIAAAHALSQAGVPWVLSPNGTAPVFEQRRMATQILQRLGDDKVARDARFVLAVSKAEEVQLAALGVPAANIRRLPNPVDTREFFDASGSYRFANRRRGADGAVVLFIGSITPSKRLDIVVDAFARVNASGARLVIAGNDLGGLQPALERGRALGVDSRIEVTGLLRSDQRLQAMADADVVVSASSDEVFGLVACEALLVGTPVIVAGDSGCAEIVGSGGITVKSGDAASLAAAIAGVLGGRVEARRGTLPGRERILRQYNVRVVSETLEGIYRQALDPGAERQTA